MVNVVKSSEDMRYTIRNHMPSLNLDCKSLSKVFTSLWHLSWCAQWNFEGILWGWLLKLHLLLINVDHKINEILDQLYVDIASCQISAITNDKWLAFWCKNINDSPISIFNIPPLINLWLLYLFNRLNWLLPLWPISIF